MAIKTRTSLSSYHEFIAIVVVMLAVDFAPPFLRMLGSTAWTSLGMTEGEWSIFTASRGLFFIIFILTAGVMGDLFGRRRMLLLILVAFMFCVPILMLNPPLSSLFVITHSIWGVLGVMIRTLCVAFLILRYEGNQRIMTLVIYSILAGLAFLLSPILTSTLKASVSFHAVFILPMVLGVIGFVLAKNYLPESRVSYDFWKLDAVALAV